MSEWRYFVYGLSVVSELYMPELEATTPHVDGDGAGARVRSDAQHDVEVRIGRIAADPDDPPNRWFFIRPDGTCIMRIHGVATYAMRGGDHLTVEAVSDADPSAVRAFLLGSGFGILHHQRGLLPLHVGAVAVHGCAVAFTAASGTGKSTLIAGLHFHAGLPLVADDVATFMLPATGHTSGGHPAAGRLWPGPPVLKLLPDALARLDTATLDMVPEYRDSDKQRIRPHQLVGPSAIPLAALIILERATEPVEPGITLERCHGVKAFLMAQTAVYRLEMGIALAGQAALFRRIGELAASVPIYVGRVSPPLADSAHRERAIRHTLESLVTASLSTNHVPAHSGSGGTTSAPHA